MKSRIRYVLIGVLVGAGLTAGIGATTIDFRTARTMEILVNMVRELQTSYVDMPDPDKLLRDAANGMTAGLDPYTQFLDESDLEAFERITTGKYAGLGSDIRQQGDTVLFSQPYKGSPADRAGIRIGDAILEVNGKTAVGVGLEAVSEMLRGEAGSAVKMRIRRLADDTEITMTIRREQIVRSGVVYYGMVNDTTGYINHADFTDNCSADFRAAVENLLGRGASRLIIDERGNGGGILQEAVKIISLFVPQGTLAVEMRSRNAENNRKFHTSSAPIALNIPLIVMIDENTASAAEILAGALQDLGRATLLGRHSFGKGLVQSTHPLGYNTWLKLTTARYYLPSGRTVERTVGLTPNIITEGQPVSRLAYELYETGVVDNFADRYWKEHQSAIIPNPAAFTLSEKIWNDFKAYAARPDDENIEPSRPELTIMLASKIIMRYLYIDGAYRYSVANDSEIKLAIGN